MPNICKIQLPSGTIYDVRDDYAHTRIDQINEMVSAGISFIIAWDGTSAPVAGDIPEGIVVSYNNTNTTGTFEAADATAGAFYLVKSKTNPSEDALDIYDEYVVIKPNTEDNSTWFWEKIGDTKLNLADVITNITLNKATDTAIGADATFTVTQPTITLAEGTGAGTMQVVTGISSATASGDSVAAITDLGSPATSSVIGADATFTITQPTVALSTSESAGDGLVEVATGASATTTNVKATASGAATAWNSKDSVTAVTGYENTTSDTFVKTISTTAKKLVTTSITGVNGSTTASKATAATSQTTATGAGTASTTNTDWLKNISVANEILSIGAATMNTQTTTQFTFSNVTVPTAASATTVATGAVAASDTNGAEVVTAASAGTSASALTGLGTPTTKSAIGASATFKMTQPTIALATGASAGTGVISVGTDVNANTTYIGATASGANTAWNSKNAQTVVKSYTPTTTNVLGTSSTITVTPATKTIKATATGGNVAWNVKREITVLTSGTTITPTKAG